MKTADDMKLEIIRWLETKAIEASSSARTANRMKVKNTYDIQAEAYRFIAREIGKMQ